MEFIANTKLADLGHNSADYIHIVTEVIKVALADREHYVGDPDFVDVPLKKLLSGKYAKDKLSLIQKTQPFPTAVYGEMRHRQINQIHFPKIPPICARLIKMVW